VPSTACGTSGGDGDSGDECDMAAKPWCDLEVMVESFDNIKSELFEVLREV
jgi:hypothetical protein